MINSGKSTRYSIGSVNSAEFFVTIVQVFTFTIFLNISNYWEIILGLAIGGMIAAPLAAVLCKKIPEKKLLILVGLLIIVTNIRSIILYFI